MQETYDIIGDVHGCLDALTQLCSGLGYDTNFLHPEGRRMVFVGDLIDRGPDKIAFKKAASTLLDHTPLYLVLDGGALIVAHAGIEEDMIGKTDLETRQFVLNGDAIGRSPEGKTLRRDWAADYRGSAFIVYGHTPQERAKIRGNTVNIDTGAYRGGLLTALRWPERALISVSSRSRFKE